jgi:hypothetical protein
LSEAHEAIKLLSYGVEPRIDLYDVPTDKAFLCRTLDLLLSGDTSSHSSGLPMGETPPLRTWELTRRGGLKEVEPGT